jgi:hypothetical protein
MSTENQTHDLVLTRTFDAPRECVAGVERSR